MECCNVTKTAHHTHFIHKQKTRVPTVENLLRSLTHITPKRNLIKKKNIL